MPATTRSEHAITELSDRAGMALYDTSLERAFVLFMEESSDGVEHLLSDSTNANAIYHACRKLRDELEALAELAANVNKEEVSP